MDRNSISSTNIKSAGWEDDILEVEFHKGGIYRYTSVPKSIYLAFAGALNPGAYFTENIKKQYSYSKA